MSLLLNKPLCATFLNTVLSSWLPASASASLHTSACLERRASRNWDHSRGIYISFFSPYKDGQRKELTRVVQRFKRLDWGAFIRPCGGRNGKHWEKNPSTTWEQEQHVFLDESNTYIVERLMLPKTKAVRYFPDDIYEKYNKTSYYKHRWAKIKNRVNIERSNSKIYDFCRWKAMLSKKKTKYNLPERGVYEPPGFLENVHNNRGVYMPENEFIPEDIPAPYFVRKPVRINKHMKEIGLGRLKVMQSFCGLLNPWDPVFKGFYKRV